MRNVLKIAVVFLFAVFAGIQFIRPDRANPPIVQIETLESTVETPENVEAILTRSCSDCHTNNTNYPWYSQITPFNWLLANHVADGRRALNFSVWNSYENRRKSRKLNEICEQATERQMPLASYLWIHRNAGLSGEEIKVLCEWSKSAQSKLAETKPARAL